MNVSSIQLPTERALQVFLGAAGVIPDGYPIFCAHDVEKPPADGNFISIIAGPGDWEELIDNATTHVEFRVATQMTDAAQRPDRTLAHQQVVGALADLLSWGNFDSALATLNAQETIAVGIQIGFSGWQPAPPPLDTNTEAQIISTLPYDMDVFVAAAES